MFDKIPLEFSEVFIEFLDYLIQQGYGEKRTGFIEEVIQKAFFDEWIKFLAYQREVKGSFSIVSKEVLDRTDF
ncbi:MAG: hypothetical protein ACXABI_11110 [Candidatus Hodarchaeales archaeon]|jgi:hypothetical protein